MKFQCAPYFPDSSVIYQEEIEAIDAFEAASEYANFFLPDVPDNGTRVIVVKRNGITEYFDAVFRTVTVVRLGSITPKQADEPTYLRDSTYDVQEDDNG